MFLWNLFTKWTVSVDEVHNKDMTRKVNEDEQILNAAYQWKHQWMGRFERTVMGNPTRNKSNDYFESLQYRQDARHIAHYHNRKHFPSYTCCSENHSNTCSENWKIRGLKFDTL